MMWWNQLSIQSATNIVNLEFWHSTCVERVTSFKKPVKISLQIRNKPSTATYKDVIRVPKDFTKLKKQELNQFIRVWRITVNYGLALRVNFPNLTEGDSYQIVLTKFKYPTIEDFEHKRMVRYDDPKIFMKRNMEDYDVWFYLGILPDKSTVTNATTAFPYEVTFFGTSCMRWNESETSWEPSCKVFLVFY